MAGTHAPVRTESFRCDGTIDVRVHRITGEVVVELVDTDLVTVDVDAATSGGAAHPGVSQAVDDLVTEFADRRLQISPRGRAADAPIRITVRVPAGSRLDLAGDAVSFTVIGRSTALTAAWTSGSLDAGDVDGPCRLRGGHGDVRIGRIAGDARIRTSGTLEIGTVEGRTVAATGVSAVSIADAASGHVQVRTGSGPVRIGVRAGVTARIDLLSRSGTAVCELPVSDRPTAGGGSHRRRLRISAVSNEGDIRVMSSGGFSTRE